MKFFYGYIVIINIIAFAVMYYDKQKAKHGKWRVAEYKMFMIALFGGAIGMFMAMRLIRHKTLHKKFTIGIPVIIIFNIIIFYNLYSYFI